MESTLEKVDSVITQLSNCVFLGVGLVQAGRIVKFILKKERDAIEDIKTGIEAKK